MCTRGESAFCSEEPVGTWHYTQGRGPNVSSGDTILRSVMLVDFLMFKIQSSVNHRGVTLSILLGYL